MAERTGKSGARKMGLTGGGDAPVRNATLAKTSPEAAVPPADDVAATCGMLRELRVELFERIDQSEHTLRGGILAVEQTLRGEVHEVRTQLSVRIEAFRAELREEIRGVRTELSGEIHGIKGQIETMQADIHGVKANMARMLFLMEEQNARNKVVLEGLASSFARHDQTEKRLDAVEETVRSLASGHRPGG